MNYCPETILVHSSFLLADKKAAENLQSADKRTCCELAQIVSGTIREVTEELTGEETCKPLDVEVRGLEFKLHSWLFSSLLSRHQQKEVDGSTEEDYFDSFPPLPHFGVVFYLEVVKELQWENLLVECLCAAGLNNVVSLFDDLVKSLIEDPSLKNVSVFLYLFDSLLMSGTQSFQSEIIEFLAGLTCSINSVSLLLIDGLGRLRNEIRDPAVKLSIIKNVIEFTFSTIVDLNFHVLSLDGMQQDTLSYENHFGGQRTPKEVTKVQLKCCGDTEIHAPDSDIHNVVVSDEFTACIDLLYQLITDDWKETSRWIQDFCDSGAHPCVGQLDCVSWHPIHEWIVKLYGIACLLISCSFDSKLLVQIITLHTGLQPYIENYSTKLERNWIDAFQRRELITQKSFEDEFSCPFESGDLLLFKPETLEEQYQFYLKRVNGNLEGCNECFDWLLSAEEFHGEPEWLECMENRALQLSGSQQALKMVDIICMQHQALAVEKLMDDKVFKTMKKILLSLFSTLLRSAQEEILEYAVNGGFTQDPSEDSVFFHPWFESEENTSFQQELVIIFNKLVDVSSDDELQCVISDILKASLLSPYLTLHKMVEEGVKSAGHAKSICHVLQKVPLLCEFHDSLTTLLCHAVREVATGVLSRQQELNLLNMVTMMIVPSPSGDTPSTPLLKVDELLNAAVMPFLSETNFQGPIPTVLVLKLLHTSFEAFKLSTTNHLAAFKKHFLPIALSLSELLNGCSVFWDGLAPDHSLSEVEELRVLVLTALDSLIEIFCEVIKTNPSFTRAVEWLFRRVKGEFDWTILLYLEELLSAANIKYLFPVPCCLLAVCEEESGGKWISDGDLGYDTEDVFTVLFEYCRVSDLSLQKILESLVPHKLPGNPTDTSKRVMSSLAQVLPHCTWIEWQRILRFCQHLIKTSVIKVCGMDHVPWSWNQDLCSNHEAHQLSALLLETMEALRSPICSSWATLHVWFHVTKHYVSALREIAEENTNALVTAGLFAHVCHVMTIVPADLTDKVFVLALDLVARVSLFNHDIVDQLKRTIDSLSSEVYKAALMQKLNQTASC